MHLEEMVCIWKEMVCIWKRFGGEETVDYFTGRAVRVEWRGWAGVDW